MVSADAVRTSVGIAGNIIALALFLSPVPTFIQICKNRSVENFSVIPYIASLANCMLWVLYGLPMVHPKSTLLLTINGAGTAIQICYIFIYIFYSTGSKRLKASCLFLADLVLIAAVSAVVLNVFHTHERRSVVVGVLCIIFCIGMYLAPLSVMKTVIETKSVKYMPLLLSITCFFNGVLWSIYGLIRFDPYITIPNGLGLLLSIAQLILHVVFYKSRKRQAVEAKTKGEQDVTEVVNADITKP